MNPSSPKPPPPESDAGQVVLWTLLGIGYYLLVMAVYLGVGFLLAKVLPPIVFPGAIGIVLVPVLAYQLAMAQLEPERRDERRGLGIALALFYGLSCLAPLVICGGILTKGIH